MSLPAGRWLTDEFFRDLFEHANDMIYATTARASSRDTKFDSLVVGTFRGVLAEGGKAATSARSAR